MTEYSTMRKTVPSPLLKFVSLKELEKVLRSIGRGQSQLEVSSLSSSLSSPEIGLLVEVLNSLWKRLTFRWNSSGWVQEAFGKCNRCVTSL